MRKICYITGTRADFGLMKSTLCLLHSHPDINLSICVTAMHLSENYGYTVQEIEESGLRICARIPVKLTSTCESMAIAIGEELIGMTQAFLQEKPDIVLLLGDRGETLAGALAAIHLNVPIVHIHGGERTGTVDEMIRHAISKIAHYHFVATEKSRWRLIQMGEIPEHIFVTGAPGLDDIMTIDLTPREKLCQQVNFDPKRPIGLLIYHPVVQEIKSVGEQVKTVLTAVLETKLQLICLTPNADAGGYIIQETLEKFKAEPDIRIIIHMERQLYLSWLAAVDVMLGNSSSAIIEAASFNLMAINIGSRQFAREQSDNIINVKEASTDIYAAIHKILTMGKQTFHNIYGDGKAGQKMLELLTKIPITEKLLAKSNGY